MVCVNHTRPHYVNQIVKTQSKSLDTRNGHGMIWVNETRPHSVNKIGKTQCKFLETRPGQGTAWARYGMCESHTAALCKSNGKDTI
jgi:hypothetical protein